MIEWGFQQDGGRYEVNYQQNNFGAKPGQLPVHNLCNSSGQMQASTEATQ